MGFGRAFKLQQPPNRGTRRARNWRTLRIGERIRDKFGVLTAWEVVSLPWRDYERSLVLCVVEVCCVACGAIEIHILNDIIRGRSRSCKRCRIGGKLARGELTLERPYPWEELDEDCPPPT